MNDNGIYVEILKLKKNKLRIDKDRDYNLWKIVHTQNSKNIEEQSPSKTYNIITSSRV